MGMTYHAATVVAVQQRIGRGANIQFRGINGYAMDFSQLRLRTRPAPSYSELPDTDDRSLRRMSRRAARPAAQTAETALASLAPCYSALNVLVGDSTMSGKSQPNQDPLGCDNVDVISKRVIFRSARRDSNNGFCS